MATIEELRDTYPNLMYAGLGKKHWKLENIKDGFQYFFDIHGHYPTAPEIDQFEYLPTARSLQRSFKGLEHLRQELGLTDLHYGKGAFRSQIARRVGVRGRSVELEVEKILIDRFGEVFVHTEKGFGDGKLRVDYFVYSPSGNFGIDVFHTSTFRDLQKNVNLKINKYRYFSFELYFLVIGDFKQEHLDSYVRAKSKALPPLATIVNLGTLIERIKTKKRYSDPLHETSS